MKEWAYWSSIIADAAKELKRLRKRGGEYTVRKIDLSDVNGY